MNWDGRHTRFNCGQAAACTFLTHHGKLEAIADPGYFNSPEILACHDAGITVTLPKPLTSSAKSDGRFGKQDFAYLPDVLPAGSPSGGQSKGGRSALA